MKSATRCAAGLLALGLSAACADDDCVRFKGDMREYDAARCAAVVEHIEGDLWVPNDQEVMEFPKLREVGGSVVASDLGGDESSIRELRFPKLERTLGAIGVYELPTLESVRAPALVSAGGVVLSDVPKLATLELPQLEYVGAVGVDRTALEVFELPELVSGSDLRPPRIAFGWPEAGGTPPVLRKIALPKLKSASSVEIENETALSELDLSSLETVPLFKLEALSQRSDALVSLELPALQDADQLVVGFTSALERVSLPKLRDASLVSLTANTALKSVTFGPDTQLMQLIANGNPMLCGVSKLAEELGAECSDCDDEPVSCVP